MQPRAVLWDLDGTLIDSRAHHWRAWRETMEAESIRLTEAQFDASFGRRNEEILSGWLGADADDARVERVGEAKEVRYRELVRACGVSVLPGAAGWVRRLRTAEWRQAIASSAPRANIEVILSGLAFGEAFDAWVSAEDVTEGKPDPEVFVVAAERLGVTPERCVVVEDAAAGIEAARRAGMSCIGVGGVRVADADVTVPTLNALPGAVFERLLCGRTTEARER